MSLRRLGGLEFPGFVTSALCQSSQNESVFVTGGTSMFGSTTTDNHNPMKVTHTHTPPQPRRAHREPRSLCWVKRSVWLEGSHGMKLRNTGTQSSPSQNQGPVLT